LGTGRRWSRLSRATRRNLLRIILRPRSSRFRSVCVLCVVLATLFERGNGGKIGGPGCSSWSLAVVLLLVVGLAAASATGGAGLGSVATAEGGGGGVADVVDLREAMKTRHSSSCLAASSSSRRRSRLCSLELATCWWCWCWCGSSGVAGASAGLTSLASLCPCGPPAVKTEHSTFFLVAFLSVAPLSGCWP
jgi:hypothetical protein